MSKNVRPLLSMLKEPLIKDPSTKTSCHWIKKWERAEVQKGLRQQSSEAVRDRQCMHGDGEIALSWNAVPGAASYKVRRSTVNGSGHAKPIGDRASMGRTIGDRKYDPSPSTSAARPGGGPQIP